MSDPVPQSDWVKEALKRKARLRTRVPPPIATASKWLADRPPQHWPRPLESEVRRLFDLTEAEAAKAIEAARLEHARAN